MDANFLCHIIKGEIIFIDTKCNPKNTIQGLQIVNKKN